MYSTCSPFTSRDFLVSVGRNVTSESIVGVSPFIGHSIISSCVEISCSAVSGSEGVSDSEILTSDDTASQILSYLSPLRSPFGQVSLLRELDELDEPEAPPHPIVVPVAVAVFPAGSVSVAVNVSPRGLGFGETTHTHVPPVVTVVVHVLPF